jgi:co-chaperonin GroES (HSP10)
MIQAFGERILVRIVETEKKKTLLIVPDEKKEYQVGQIVSIGGDLPISESNEGGFMEPGSYVWTRKYAGLLLEYDSVEYVSLDSKEILAFSSELH